MFDVTSSSSSTSANKDALQRPMSQTSVNEKRRNYRFYAGDPAIHPADKRLYANGDFEGTPLHVSGCPDPREITRTDRAYFDLPVPKFKLDRSWVGVIPAKEVTFRNLNDNITKIFLTDMCKRFGDIDDCKIYYDRQTKKHLGLGTVIFKSTKAARECVNALNMTTKMGSTISVSLETSGQERTKQYATLIRAQEQEKAAQEKALAASAAASPPPPPPTSSLNDSTYLKQSDRSHYSNNHKINNNNNNNNSSYSQSSKYHSTSSRNHHENSEQFSFNPYGSFGHNSNNHKSSRRSHHHSRYQQSHSSQYRRRRKPSTSSTTSSSSRSSSSRSSSSSSSSSTTNSSRTSKSYSRSSSSTSSRSSYSSAHSRRRKSSYDSRTKTSRQQKDEEIQRPSLDDRIAALFQQHPQQTTSSSSSVSSKSHHRPSSNDVPPSNMFSYPPPPLPNSLTNAAGHHHQQQQSYGVVNNFNFFGNSFPPASFLNSAGGTNWQDMFKQPPPPSSSSSSSTTITTTTTTINNSLNGFQPFAHDEREKKTQELTSTVTNVVSSELIEILRRDLAKKLIETLVYKSIETWYDIEERKEKIRKIKSAETTTNEQTNISHEQSNTTIQHSLSNPLAERTPDETTPSPITPQTAPVLPSTSTTSTYFEQMRDNSGAIVRPQMPKIPTFKKRTIPEEKPVISQKSSTSVEKKEIQKSIPTRKISRKRLKSSSSESDRSPSNDDSQSRDSISNTIEDISSSDSKITTKTPIEPTTPEEEEGEIRDDEEEETKLRPVTPPLPPPSSTTTKKTPKTPKKPTSPKKRKIEQIKTEPLSEHDDIDNSTLAKRKKNTINLQQITNETSNLLENLSTPPVQSIVKPYNRYSYIEIEHDYALWAKQPVPVAKRLTIDGLNDMGVQAPIIVVPKPKFPAREHDAEMKIMYEINQGVDDEDMLYLKQSFQKLSEEGHSSATKTRWVDHPATRDSSFVKQPIHKHRTGCARTEGYYKIIKEEIITPMKTADGAQHTSVLPQAIDTNRTTGAQMSRELRSEHRRNLLALGDAEFADHFKFSQLKLRKKRLRYAKSSIHSWGLFACEPIAMEDMVIEYVGETIRQSVGDLREKQYELEGINSNYMFRVDSDTIVDATKCGNLARFINHSCDPNCYAKIIPVESQKKIVIYSRRDIRLGEEITYDYKFPLEDQKIPCRCGTPTCRGSLN